MSTPDKALRIKKGLSKTFASRPAGTSTALAITHQHYDHLSGFIDARARVGKRSRWTPCICHGRRAAAAKGEHSGAKDFRQILDDAAKEKRWRSR